ncbi:CapA family protein [Aneurinibacillus terranovensis]|uniref:CapA family protein n=1 Tax=Aneurinibacillus terranovensis TaxID=278991 RepID=UPI0004285223|nr:CapA family protein [Aneurinibacillus terranovensis]
MSEDLYLLMQKLYEYRLDLGITLQEIEQETGIDHERLKRIEEGTIPITVEEVDKLLTFYDINANSLLSYQEMPTVRKKRGFVFAVWIVALLALGVGGYKSIGMLQAMKSASQFRMNPSVDDIVNKKQPVQNEKTVGELFSANASNTAGTSTGSTDSTGGQSKHPSAGVGFRMVMFGDTSFYAAKVNPAPPCDFQLIPIKGFKPDSDMPSWLSDASTRTRTAVDLANNDILNGQSRKEVDKGLSILHNHHITTLGYGTKDKAFSPVILQKNNVNYGFVSFSRLIPDISWKATRMEAGVADAYGSHPLNDIKKAKEKADVLVVSVFWGKKNQEAPEDYQRQLAHDMIDAGADVIIGHRTSNKEVYEKYKGKYIFYSVGPNKLDVLFNKEKVKELAFIKNNKRTIIH